MDLARDLTQKRVLITGASSGIGAHFARLCAESGAYVGIAARRTERLEELGQELLQTGAEGVCSLELDVSDGASIHACSARAIETFGGLDILVNNAGIVRQGPALDQTAEDFDAVIDVNLRGVWLMAISCGRHWRETKTPGNIINITSTGGLKVGPDLASYGVSKAGAVHMTKALAREFADYGVRVNALAPGYFETELNTEFLSSEKGVELLQRLPMGRKGDLEELDGPFLLLASDASSYMTGSVIPVDGGYLVSSM